MALTALLNGIEKLQQKEKEDFSTSSLEGEGKVLGLYFSAHWCPPCRIFTPQLAEWYKNFKKGPNADKFDILFVSSDRDQSSFDEYYKEMPWLALPFRHRDAKTHLSRKFKVSGIPTLVFVNAETGKLITNTGRSVIQDDPEGKEFPWMPKTFEEIMTGNFVGKDDKEYTMDDLKGKVLGLYFSAHWCGPCRGFTPELVKFYEAVQKELEETDMKKFEIVFVSSDRDEEQWKSYYKEMPWLALPFSDSRKKQLSALFEISGIPTLVLIDSDGKVITTKGRNVVMDKKEGKATEHYPWYPELVNELTARTAGDINDSAALICLTDGTKEDMEDAKQKLKEIAEEYTAKCKEKGDDPELCFFYADIKDEDGISDSLMEFVQIKKDDVKHGKPVVTLVDIPQQKVYPSDEEAEEYKDKPKALMQAYLDKTISGRMLKS